MFQKLCGDDVFKNVVIVTTFWDTVDPDIGAARETELETKATFYESVLEKGAQMVRHNNTISSAQDILGRIPWNKPVSLRIQKEIVDEGKGISATAAGAELGQGLNDQIRKQEEEIRQLVEDIEQARRDKDEELKKELEAESESRRAETERLRNDLTRLESAYLDQEKKLEAERTRARSTSPLVNVFVEIAEAISVLGLTL